MPIYEYKCQQCGVHFEKRQSVSDAPLTACEHCNGRLEKQWSLSGFQFKGDGWYVTDYAGKKGGPAESTSSGESASKPKEETKSATTTTDSSSKSTTE